MNIEDIRLYCMGKPWVTEDFPFDETTLVFRLQGKIFACISLDHPDTVTMKCAPDYAVELRERYAAIAGAWHWNKKYWNQVDLTDYEVTDELLRSLLDHAYDEVMKKLPAKVRRQLMG